MGHEYKEEVKEGCLEDVTFELNLDELNPDSGIRSSTRKGPGVGMSSVHSRANSTHHVRMNMWREQLGDGTGEMWAGEPMTPQPPLLQIGSQTLLALVLTTLLKIDKFRGRESLGGSREEFKSSRLCPNAGARLSQAPFPVFPVFS